MLIVHRGRALCDLVALCTMSTVAILHERERAKYIERDTVSLNCVSLVDGNTRLSLQGHQAWRRNGGPRSHAGTCKHATLTAQSLSPRGQRLSPRGHRPCTVVAKTHEHNTKRMSSTLILDPEAQGLNPDCTLEA